MTGQVALSLSCCICIFPYPYPYVFKLVYIFVSVFDESKTRQVALSPSLPRAHCPMTVGPPAPQSQIFIPNSQPGDRSHPAVGRAECSLTKQDQDSPDANTSATDKDKLWRSAHPDQEELRPGGRIGSARRASGGATTEACNTKRRRKGGLSWQLKKESFI